tara:strand:+ start:286 stop:669 length:384 start_codon:yes stop_codon:yes gene_type:complete
MKLYLNSYFYDPDHPYGIIIMEITQEKIEKYPLLNSMYNELISSGEEKINNHSFNCEDNELAKEIILLSKENPPLARARGWKEYCNLEDPQRIHNLSWAIIELANNKDVLVNDFFWGKEVDEFLKNK